MIEDYIKLTVDETIKRANKIFNLRLGTPRCVFDLKGTTAGMFCWINRDCKSKESRFRFNKQLLNENQNDMDNTIVHEVAHYVTRRLYHAKLGYKKLMPHGKEWKYVMKKMGISDPKRCHSYACTVSRKQKRWEYQCSCGLHSVSTTLHNKMRSGEKRICLKCKDKITYTGKQL